MDWHFSVQSIKILLFKKIYKNDQILGGKLQIHINFRLKDLFGVMQYIINLL